MKTTPPTKLPLNGIVRNGNTLLSKNALDSEQLLNLRPIGDHWQLIPEKANAFAEYLPTDNSVRKIYLHQMSGTKNLIALRVVSETGASLSWTPVIERKQEDEDEEETEEETTFTPVWHPLFSFEVNTENPKNQDQVSIASVGNYLCISTPALHTYLYRDGDYQCTTGDEVSAPAISWGVDGHYTDHGELISNYKIATRGSDLGGCYYREYATDQYPLSLLTGTTQDCVTLNMGNSNTPKKWGNMSFDENAQKELLTSLSGEYLAMQNSHKNYREGYVLICSAWELYDGSISNVSEPILLHLGCEQIEQDFADHLGRIFDADSDIDVYYNRDKISFKFFAADDLSESSDSNATFSCHVRRQWVQRLHFERPSTLPDGTVYRKAVYFVSQPLSMYDISSAEFDYLHTIYHYDVLTSTKGLLEGGESSHRYYRLNLKHALTDHEGLPEQLPTAEWVSVQLMYRAAEFDLTDAQDTQPKYVDFSTLSSGDVLPATHSTRYTYSCGGLLTYNRRLHLWNYTRKYSGHPIINAILPRVPCGFRYQFTESSISDTVTERKATTLGSGSLYHKPVLQQAGETEQELLLIFRINLGQSYLYHYRTLKGISTCTDAQGNAIYTLPPFITFPDSRADQVTICYAQQDGTYRQTSATMQASSAYNYAFALNLANEDDDYNAVSPLLPDKDVTTPGSNLITKIRNADNKTLSDLLTDDSTGNETEGEAVPNGLLVSEVDNPMVFPSNQSYQFDHPIVSAAVSATEISLAQTGQYPLAVFTEGGIWAMEVGSETCYATQIPISAEVCICHNVLNCPAGIAFIGRDGVMLLNGRKVYNLSQATDGPLLNTLDQNTAVKDASYGHPQHLCSAGLYCTGIGNKLSGGITDIANSTAVIGYDQQHREIMVSNIMPDLPQTYLYQIDQRCWYSRSGQYHAFSGNYGVQQADPVTQNGISIVKDLNTETFETDKGGDNLRQMLILTRPFMWTDLDYHHLPGSAIWGQFIVNGNKQAGYYLAGSNDLKQWHMVSGVQWNCHTSQARLPRTKWRWRYCALLLCAECGEGTEIDGITY